MKYLAIILFLLLTGANLLFSRDNPHAELEDPAKCGTCHAGEPSQGKELTKSANELCFECHDHGDVTHPLEIPQTLTCPPDLPLDPEGKVYCMTCHVAHGEWESSRPWVSSSALGGFGRLFGRKKKHKTYFLRRNNSKGDLCLCCHNNY